MVVVAGRGYYGRVTPPRDDLTISCFERRDSLQGLQHHAAAKTPVHQQSPTALSHLVPRAHQTEKKKTVCSREEEAGEQKNGGFSGDFAKDELEESLEDHVSEMTT